MNGGKRKQRNGDDDTTDADAENRHFFVTCYFFPTEDIFYETQQILPTDLGHKSKRRHQKSFQHQEKLWILVLAYCFFFFLLNGGDTKIAQRLI